MLLGYARVSTQEQDSSAQIAALESAGARSSSKRRHPRALGPAGTTAANGAAPAEPRGGRVEA